MSATPDIADIIAGALGCSRGQAYREMFTALQARNYKELPFGTAQLTYELRSGSGYECDAAYEKLTARTYGEMVGVLEGTLRGVPVLDPAPGDLLPEVGTRVKIHLAREDLWVEHEVVGFYVWGDLKGDRWLQRVFVRVRHDDGSFNARPLHEVRTLEDKPLVDWGRDRLWKHTKSQGVYERIGLARLQTDTPLVDMDAVIVYEGTNGQLWVRPAAEFGERFEAVKA